MSEVLSRTIRIMDSMTDEGHTSFGWDADDDEWVIPMIRQKMQEGHVFWIVQRNPLREVRLERVEDVRSSRHVIIRDDAARVLFEQGRIGIVAADDSEVETVRRARTPEEAASHDTVSHRRLRGG